MNALCRLGIGVVLAVVRAPAAPAQSYGPPGPLVYVVATSA
jgi:hypothetical protein